MRLSISNIGWAQSVQIDGNKKRYGFYFLDIQKYGVNAIIKLISKLFH